MKKILSALVMSTLLFGAGSAEAYQQWQGYCARQTTAYTNPELTRRNGVEYVGAGDNVTVHDEQGNAYYVEYPLTRGGTKTRWVPKSAISGAPSSSGSIFVAGVEKAAQAAVQATSYQPWSGYCARQTTAYTNPELTQRNGVEYVGAGDNVTILAEQGSAYYVEYPLTRGGTKKRWIPKSAISSSGRADTAPSMPSNTIIGEAPSRPATNTSYQSWSGYCARKTTAYTNPELTQRSGVEYVGAGDNVTVLGEQGSAYYVEYPLTRGGTKKRWIPKSAISQQGGFSGSVSNITSSVATGTDEEKIKNRITDLKNNSKYKVNTKYWGTSQCRGFANDIYTQLFSGVSRLSSETDDNIGAATYNGSWIVGVVKEDNMPSNYPKGYSYSGNRVNNPVPISQSFKDKVRDLFLKAKPGYFVQMARRYSLNSKRDAGVAHSAIVYYVDNNGCCFYEANTDGYNTITSGYYDWDKLADRNLGFTLYAPNNYWLK